MNAGQPVIMQAANSEAQEPTNKFFFIICQVSK
jgi:hypothetical protein